MDVPHPGRGVCPRADADLCGERRGRRDPPRHRVTALPCGPYVAFTGACTRDREGGEVRSGGVVRHLASPLLREAPHVFPDA